MGFFKKIFKGIGKIFKKIGKGVKKAFKGFGKFMNKIGVVGQIAMMFIPFGQIFGPMLQGLQSSFLGVLGKGLASASPLIKGASTLVNAAYKTGAAIYKGYKTVTGAVTSFLGETTKFLGNKMGFKVENAAGSFFGKGADSVLGRVGTEVVSNFNGFKEALGGIIELNPTAKGVEYMKKANIMKGEYKYQSPDIDPETMKIDPDTGKRIAGTGKLYERDIDGNIMPGTSIRPPIPEDIPIIERSNKVRTQDLDFETLKDRYPERDIDGNIISDGSSGRSLLSRTGEYAEQKLVQLPVDMAQNALMQEVNAVDPIERQPRRAFDFSSSFMPDTYGLGFQSPVQMAAPSVPSLPSGNTDYQFIIAQIMNSLGTPLGNYGNPNMSLSQQPA